MPDIPRPRADRDYPLPSRRRLRVFSVDPTYSRLQGETVVLSVPWERLQPGPRGSRIDVVDWIPGGPAPKVNLDDPHLLAQDGLAPDQSDPRFRQQMVYAVLASLLETWDQARGRRLVWRNVWRRRDDPPNRVPEVRPLTVIANQPGLANAHFTPGTGLTFGSYPATADLAAGVFPGQTVYGCLSHDIVNHEAGHAFLYELRPLSMEPIGPDALAFHEALGDILAILQHFRLPGLLEAAITRSGVAIWEPGPFVELAGEFGRGAGRQDGTIDAVRNALEPSRTPAILQDSLVEPHQRGAVLVAAVFDAFFASYAQRIEPLLRAAGLPLSTPARGGDGAGEPLSADLVRLVCDEARAAAAMVTTMVVRAIDYLPPAAIRFGDFLDAVVTSDTDLSPEDRDGFRRLFVEACRRRNIQPIVTHPDYPRDSLPVARTAMPTESALLAAALDLGTKRSGRSSPTSAGSWHRAVRTWAQENFAELELADYGLTPAGLVVDGGNASFRLDQDGLPTAIITTRLIERNEAAEATLPPRLAGVRLYGGVTIIAHPDGRVRRLLGRPVPGVGQAGQALLRELLDATAPHPPAQLGCLTEPQATVPVAIARP